MAKGTHTPQHVRGVAEILETYPDARTMGFPTVIRDLRAELGCEDDPPEVHFIPDAFRLNRDTHEIEIFEVEVTHPTPISKLHELGVYWSYWDAEDNHEWLPVLITVDRFGQSRRFDLSLAYLDALSKSASLQGEAA